MQLIAKILTVNELYTFCAVCLNKTALCKVQANVLQQARLTTGCAVCCVEDMEKARRKAKLAENTSDLDTVSSDVERQVSRKKRA